MLRIEFINLLDQNNDKLKIRDELVDATIKNNYILILLNRMADVDHYKSNFSARILELACKRNLELLLPHLNTFCDLLDKVKLDGVIRACAKVCELLMIEIFIKNNSHFKNAFHNELYDKIVEAGFNWMITNQKIAVQAYTMHTLYLLGIQYDWIQNELALLIEKNIPYASIGYKNRGNKIIKAIRTKTKLKL